MTSLVSLLWTAFRDPPPWCYSCSCPFFASARLWISITCGVVGLLSLFGLNDLTLFELCLAWNRDCFALVEEVFLGLLFRDEGKVLWHASLFVILWGI